MFSLKSHAIALGPCDTGTYLVMISPKVMSDSSELSKTLNIIKSPELEVQSERITAAGRMLIQITENDKSMNALETLAEIPGVMVECEIIHHANPRLTGAN